MAKVVAVQSAKPAVAVQSAAAEPAAEQKNEVDRRYQDQRKQSVSNRSEAIKSVYEHVVANDQASGETNGSKAVISLNLATKGASNFMV